MKKKERYKLLVHAKENYSNKFNCNYEFKKMSKKSLYQLLKNNQHSSMCEWSYCCYGLYQSCWQELICEGICGFTQKRVDKYIKYVIDKTAKICRKDNRILYCEDEYGINVIIVTRDITGNDYLIAFTNQELME